MRFVRDAAPDVRQALLAMRRAPGFASFAILTLALGIGMNVSTFAVSYGMLVRPLPYPDASRIVIFNLLFPDGGDFGFSPGAIPNWLSRLRTTDAAAAYYRREVTVRSGSRSAVVSAAVVTDRFFDVLRTPADSGRASVNASSPDVVIARRHLRDVVGTDVTDASGVSVTIADIPRVIAGVMPDEFAVPNDDTAVWLPLRAAPRAADGGGYSKIVARLSRGVTLQQFREDANRVRLELDPKSAAVVSIVTIDEAAVGGLRRIIVASVAGSVLVLFVAAANVATLFIGRDLGRRQALATRIALGAERGRLVRAVLIEALVTAALASVAGVALGAAALAFFVRNASTAIEGLHRARIDAPVALATTGLTILVTLICAAVPAWAAARHDFSAFLRPTSGARPRTWRGRRALAVTQIACCSILLIGAGLLVRTVSVLGREDAGYRPDGALAAKVVLSDAVLFDTPDRRPFVRALVERVSALPGVRQVGFGSTIPPRTPLVSIGLRLVTDRRDETRIMSAVTVTPGFLQAVGAEFIAGRDFRDAEVQAGASVAVLSESIARFYFAGADPIGRTLARLPSMFGMADAPRIVGVVRDVKYGGLDAPAGSVIFLPWDRRPLGTGYLVARADDDPRRLAADIRRVARDLDSSVPVPELQTLADVASASIAGRRSRAVPATGFALLALGVALAGLLATLSTLVAERRRDLAIRAALGASPARLASIVAGQGIALTASGLVLGMAAAASVARVLSPLLYHVSQYDALTFGATGLLIGGGGTIVICIAAMRAVRVDPVALLRHE